MSTNQVCSASAPTRPVFLYWQGWNCHNVYKNNSWDYLIIPDMTLTLYADGRSLRSCWKDDPHSGCLRLLQAPVTVLYLSSLSQFPEARGIKKQSESEIEKLSCWPTRLHGFVLKYFHEDECWMERSRNLTDPLCPSEIYNRQREGGRERSPVIYDKSLCNQSSSLELETLQVTRIKYF